MKPENIYVDIAKYVETRFDTSSCEFGTVFPNLQMTIQYYFTCKNKTKT